MCRQALGETLQGIAIRHGKLCRQMPQLGMIGLRVLHQNRLARLAQQRQQLALLKLKVRFQLTFKSTVASRCSRLNLLKFARGGSVLGVQGQF